MKTADPFQVVEIEPDEECLADNVLLRDETPATTVEASIQVITHHEIVTRRNGAGKAAISIGAVVAERVLDGLRNRGRCVILHDDLVFDAAQFLGEAWRVVKAIGMEIITGG